MLTFDSLPDKVKENYKRNVTASVAFVKKDGTVRHIAFRRNIKAYVPSDAPKTEKQINMLQNNNLMQVVDTNAYIKALKELGGDKEAASKKAFRNFKLDNVLAFMASGQVFDMRDENNIMEKFGEEVYSQLTPNMKAALQNDINQSSDVDKHLIEPNDGAEQNDTEMPVQESDMFENETDTNGDDDLYNPEVDYEAMIADYENQEANKYASRNDDDVESGAIHEALSRMKKLINH